MEFNFFRKEKEGRSIEELKQEEADGLRRLYKEIITPEILKQNFATWHEHLAHCLKNKYPDETDQEVALEKAREFARKLPIRHAANYEALRASLFPYIASNFMVHGLGQYKGTGNTSVFDMEHELDHFVYGWLGVAEPVGENIRKEWNTQVYIRNKVLSDEGTLVALEDFGWGTSPRLIPQNYKGNSNYSGPDTAFLVHLQQIWKGGDFNILFPMMLAYAYENSEDFESEEPFPIDLVPEGLPRLAKGKLLFNDNLNPYYNLDFPKFEVRIPRLVIPSDIIGIFVDSSVVQKDPMEKHTVIVPSNLSVAEKREFIRARLRIFEAEKA
jgi:hypothetical protein